MKEASRERNWTIIKYNIIGIVMNFLLAILKVVFGIAVHSHAVMLDGINGFSDMFSSALSIASSAFGNRRASRQHPLGFGRLEYIFSFVITIVIGYLAIRAIVDSVEAIISPHEPPEYTATVFVLMVVSLALKISYGILLRTKGKKLNSIAMVMTGTESMGDALVSISVLAAILIRHFTGVDIEHYLCIAISILMLYTAFGMIRECLTKLLGARMDPKIKREIIRLLAAEDEVLNVSNLVLHNYGEGIMIGSVDIEVEETMDASEISRLSRKLIRKAEEKGIVLTSVGISASNTSNPEAAEIWDRILYSLKNDSEILRAYSFYADFESKEIMFSIVPDPSVNEREKVYQIEEEVKRLFPEMSVRVHAMLDI